MHNKTHRGKSKGNNRGSRHSTMRCSMCFDSHATERMPRHTLASATTHQSLAVPTFTERDQYLTVRKVHHASSMLNRP